MSLKNLSIKVKMSIAVITVIIILTGVLTFYSINQTDNIVTGEEENTMDGIGDFLNSKMNEQLNAARMSVLSIANNPDIQELFADRNREDLTNRLLPVFNELSDDVAQIQFHEPDSTSFLRLHAIDNYGDDLSDFRETVNQANREEEMVMGLEEGRGGFGFRVVVPMFYNEEHIGSVEYGSAFDNQFLNEAQDEMGGDYFIYIFEDVAGIAWDAVEEGRLGATTTDDWEVSPADLEKVRDRERVFLLSEDNNERILLEPFEDFQGRVTGYIKVVQDRQAIVAQSSAITRNMLFIGIAGIVVSGIIILLLINNIIIKPVNLIQGILNKLSNKNLAVQSAYESGDEIGLMSADLNKTIIDLDKAMQQIRNGSENVSAAAMEISDGNQDLSQRTEEQASSLEEFSATVEQITSSIQSTTTNAKEADSISEDTMKSVRAGEEVVGDMQEAMVEITESSQQIAEIIDQVNDIAFQTNLLALNAAVEAARAGDAGQGFAVVAGEVRNLAGKAAESASEVEKLINTSIEKIQNGNQLMTETEEVLQEIVKNTERTSDVVGEIAAALKEQNLAAGEIKNAIDELNQVTQQNAALVEEIASSSSNMSDEAENMAGLVDEFELRDQNSINKLDF